MHTSEITMAQLFEQLGLDASDTAIAQFIKQHHLPEEILLKDAPFWTESQRQFIHDSFRQDSDWVVIVDQLNTLLHN